jgi:hypothetical protein
VHSRGIDCTSVLAPRGRSRSILNVWTSASECLKNPALKQGCTTRSLSSSPRHVTRCTIPTVAPNPTPVLSSTHPNSPITTLNIMHPPFMPRSCKWSLSAVLNTSPSEGPSFTSKQNDILRRSRFKTRTFRRARCGNASLPSARR